VLNAIDKNLCDISIHHSFQTATVLGFNDLITWCKKHSIKLTGGVVYDPSYLSIKSLPGILKDKILEQIIPNQKYFINEDNTEDNVLSYNNLILKIQNVEYDPLLNKKFFEYIEWYQSNKDIPKLQTIFPELYNH
jgi:hypothetical protein